MPRLEEILGEFGDSFSSEEDRVCVFASYSSSIAVVKQPSLSLSHNDALLPGRVLHRYQV